MQQRRAQKPGHEAHVLDRVPEPPAAPAQFIIGPPRSKSDTCRKADPRGQCPRADPSGPGRIDAPFQKSRNGKGKHDGEADIPEIQERRVHGETHVLKQRVEVIAVERRRKHPLEGVRRQQQEGQEADADPRLHRQGARLGLGGDVRSEPGDARAEHREYQDPEQQRTLMAAPGPGHLVEHWLERMGVLDDVPDGKIADDESLHQRCEGDGHKQHLSYCRRLGGFHPDGISTRRTCNR